MSKNNKSIQELVYCLVKNHLRVSLESSEWPELVYKEALDDRVERRVVVIVGAGASNSIGLPLSRDALDILRKKSKMEGEALDTELDRLAQIYKLDRDAFETTLRALSTNAYDAQKLRDNLQEMFGHRFMPVLGYEILAHMLKHRFIDAIVNFNFDELLDQSIIDELEPEEYHRILSDGDCPDDKELRRTSPELPFYIKPHGTASHKSTLRFTREDYYGLPLDIQRVLRYLLTDKPVVLLVIGFGMQSLELNHILEKAKEGSMMFHINQGNPATEEAFEKFKPNELLNIDASKTDIVGDTLEKLWGNVSMAFKDEYLPRAIKRHSLVAKTFSRNIDTHDVERYLRGRTMIELCLSIAKAKGLATISFLSKDRSGRYFDHYKTHNSDANFYEMCRRIGLKDIGYSREAMRLMKYEKNGSEILNEKDFEKEIDFLYDSVQDNLDADGRKNLDKSRFYEILWDLYRGQEVELRYHPHSPYTKVFRYAKPIPTYNSFKFYTHRLIKQDWKYLLLVAETGQWLTEKHIAAEIHKKAKQYEKEKKGNVKIYLVVADMSWAKKIREKYRGIKMEIRKLPWWEHNRHMTILVNANRVPFSSIYFSRRLRSTNITPVLLDNVDDSLVALESFNAYWIKASRLKKKNSKETTDWISSSEAKNFDNLFAIVEKSKRNK